MAHTTDTEVIICGTGAAGLTLAIDLARRQVDFLLIDKAPHPFIGSRGKGIQPRSQELFEDLGVLDRLVASGGWYPLERVYAEDGGAVDKAAVVTADPTPAEPYQRPLLVPQFLTERRLRERLAELGHAPLYGHELVGFDQDADAVSARITTPDGELAVRARYLIGADGGSSFVRKSLGIDFPGKTLGVRAMVADVLVDGVSADVWHRWGQGSAAQISLCPLYGTDMFQLQGPVPFGVDVDLSAEGLTALLRERTGRQDVVVRSVSWASAFTMNSRLAATYRRGRVFLAGDAAHCHPPTGGQGLNTSVQDAYNLGWKLAAVLDGAPESLLATYEQERRPIAEAVLGLSEKLLEAAKNRDNRRGREVSQLDLGYPDSPLSLPGGPDGRSGVLPGDRAPDAPVTGAGGLGTRLFTLFQGPHWTLLGYEVDAATAPTPRAGLRIHIVGARGDLADSGGHVGRAYGAAAGQWVLVRPDGYVAAVRAAADLDAIGTYLDTVGVGPARRRVTGAGGDTPVPAAPERGAPATRREHRDAREAAERRRATAERELHRLQRQVTRDLRAVRREAETAVTASRAELAVLGAQALAKLAASLRLPAASRVHQGSGPLTSK